jgi:hypothetical protein
MNARAAAARARMLLACGLAAGPFYLIVALVQAFTRDGFEITRHAVSLLSLGPLGWIQVANFAITGALVLACALGLRTALRGTRGGAAGPTLIAVYGAALIASGVLPADAGFGFPPGTAEGPPEAFSTSGTLHFVSGGVGFFALIAACLVFAGRFASLKEPGWALFSAATGLIFLTAFMGIASAPPRAATVLGLWAALALTWLWLAALAAKLIGMPASMLSRSERTGS